MCFFFTISSPISWRKIQAEAVWLENAPFWKAPPPFAENHECLTLTSGSNLPSCLPLLLQQHLACHCLSATPSPRLRHHASVIWSVEINGFYFHGIAMVMNRVVNHRIARVTDRVINQDFFSPFAMPQQHVQVSERHTLVISQLIHVRANTHTCCSCSRASPQSWRTANQRSDSVAAAAATAGLIKLSLFRSRQTHSRRAATVRC